MQRDARSLLEGQLAAVLLRLAGEDSEQRRLAGAVRAGERHAVAPLDAERHPVEEQRAGELLAEVGCDHHGHAASKSRFGGMASVLAVDVGSSSVRAQVFGERGEGVDELRQAAYGGNDPDEIVALVREVVAGTGRERGRGRRLVLRAEPPRARRSGTAADAGARLAGQPLGRRGRGAEAAHRSGGRPRAHGPAPSPELLAGQAALAGGGAARRLRRDRALCLDRRLPLRRAARDRAGDERVDRLVDGAARSRRQLLGRGAARAGRRRREPAAPDRRRAARSLVPGAVRRRLLQCRRRLHRPRAGGADGRHLGCAAGPVRDGRAAAAAGAVSLPGGRAALRRGRRALRRRQPRRLAGPDARGSGGLARRTRPGRPRPDVPPVPRRRALDRLGPGRRGAR